MMKTFTVRLPETLVADIEAARETRDEKSDRDGADQVDDNQPQRSHGQRSWSLMMARGPALRKNR